MPTKLINNIQALLIEKMGNTWFDKDDCNAVWNLITECYSEVKDTNTELAKINRAKTEVAKEILDKIYTIWEEHSNNNNYDWVKWYMEDMINEMTSYIEKEHLFKSDYTK